MELSAIAFKPRLLFAAEVEDHRVPHDIVHIAGIVGRHFVVVVISRIRLYPYKINAYFNSGVLLMNLKLQRKLVDEEEIYSFIEKNRTKLILPDQDIINTLYSDKIKSLDEKLYNYDTRYYNYYKVTTNNTCDMDYIMRNTVILHFCGKKKPWLKGYSGKFHSLYKHYERKAIPE
jgi:lipopolysaccharide biosynthesis glycosyltransferase